MQHLEEFIVNLQTQDGNAHPQHWYLSPYQHVIEYFVGNLFFGGLLVLTLLRFRNREETQTKPNTKIERGRWDKVFGFSLLVCLIIQTYYNYLMNPKWVVNMLHPCHIMSLLNLYLIFGSNPNRLHAVFNISLFYTYLTCLALGFPDTSMLYLPFHIHVFWIQHSLLLLLPAYFVWNSTFKLDVYDYYYYNLANALGGLFCFNIQLPASFITSMNVNYMLAPPPGSPFSGQYYRALMGALLGTLSWFSGFLFPRAVHLLMALYTFYSPPSATVFQETIEKKHKAA
eukprot:TRINITY_DN8043_c0_g1_i1.p1 TRINITY_DN8043_c0_g1~~TRINITY_DN8043_c0_g1_i1.p1  ORF type:complete len:285 (+),score=44.79 TRINITY_DN8043_c0_g1_i1:743-1597(+)